MSEWLSPKGLQIIYVGKDVEKRQLLYTVGGNVNWCSRYGTVRRFLKKLKIELPYDPAIPLLGMNTEKTKTLIQKDKCTPMFTVALFITAKTRKQPKCPPTDEQIKMCYRDFPGDPVVKTPCFHFRGHGFDTHTHTHTHTLTHTHIYIHTHNGKLAIKRNEILRFAAMSMDLENIMLSEI